MFQDWILLTVIWFDVEDEDEAMVCSQLGTMTMVNMMLNLPHVVSMQVRKFWFHDDEDRLLLLKLQLLYYQISNTSYWKQHIEWICGFKSYKIDKQ